MDTKIVRLVKSGDAPADAVLREAQAEGLTEVVVVGWNRDGLMYYRSSYASRPEQLWLLEQARDAVLDEGRE